jgi:hypothetical protein
LECGRVLKPLSNQMMLLLKTKMWHIILFVGYIVMVKLSQFWNQTLQILVILISSNSTSIITDKLCTRCAKIIYASYRWCLDKVSSVTFLYRYYLSLHSLSKKECLSYMHICIG